MNKIYKFVLIFSHKAIQIDGLQHFELFIKTFILASQDALVLSPQPFWSAGKHIRVYIIHVSYTFVSSCFIRCSEVLKVEMLSLSSIFRFLAKYFTKMFIVMRCRNGQQVDIGATRWNFTNSRKHLSCGMYLAVQISMAVFFFLLESRLGVFHGRSNI